MPTHNIIDNRHEKLVDHIQTILPNTKSAKFAVGYFFLSGLEALGTSLDTISELRLLIGNTSNRETIEQLSEAYKRLDEVSKKADEQRFARRADLNRQAGETAENLRDAVGLMDQTDEAEELVHSLVRMVEEGRLKVRVYTKGRLHAKAYIFDYTNANPTSNGVAIVGSSNLTLSGIQDNTELNVLVHDNAPTFDPTSGNHGKLTAWFGELWDESQDFDELLMTELKASWAAQLATPYEVYMKTLYTLVRDRLEGEQAGPVLLSDDEITRSLADFQRVAVQQAVRMIQEFGGCFVADVVGLGKSFIGAAIVKHFERAHGKRPLIICPKSLEEMWITYNEQYHLNAQVLPMSMLQDGERSAGLLDNVRYPKRDFILIDESHNFRHSDTQRYKALQNFLLNDPDRQICLLTATPRNSRAWDVFNQIKLFHPDDRTDTLPIDPPDLRQYFKKIEKDRSSVSGGELAQLQDVLRHVLIRRTRRHILRWYGHAGDSHKPLREMSDFEAARYLDGGSRAYVNVGDRQQYFPIRELETLRYSIEDTYAGLYQEIRGYVGKPRGSRAKPKPGEELTYARYGLFNYVLKHRQADYTDLRKAGVNLRGLIRTMLFKRFESSVEAFRQTLGRMIATQSGFLLALNAGIVPAGEKAENLLSHSDTLEEDDLLDALAEMTGRYSVADFDLERLRSHIEADIHLLRTMLALVEPITSERDDKFQTLLKTLERPPINGRKKVLIFTQYADTAKYLYENLNPGGARDDIDVIYGTEKSKARVVARFAPKANPGHRWTLGDSEINLLVATDVLAEGLNMQDCDIVINYDLHWNPVRLIQRFGRIDRIGSEHDRIWGMNFLPEIGIEKNLGLKKVLDARIQEIHDTIGEDAAILDRGERLNPDAMYSIYDAKSVAQLSLFEEDNPEQYVDLNEAEEILRSLRQEDPDEFQRIADLRDGIRSVTTSRAGDLFVFCQAGGFQQLFLVNRDGEIVSRDMARVLGAIKAERNTPVAGDLPKDYNQHVMSVKRRFADDVKNRISQRDHVRKLSPNQSYVRKALQIYYRETESEETRDQINVLERAFVGMAPTEALNKELRFLRLNKVTGQPLVSALIDLYNRHRLNDRMNDQSRAHRDAEIPRIVCSSALT